MYGMRRPQRTDLDMINSGEWVMVGHKHYRHVSGSEVHFDPNRWLWVVDGGAGWQVLHGARSHVESSQRPNY